MYLFLYGRRCLSSDKVEEALEKLRNNAVTVVAGQQAGLLTGPLYTIHKIISVIQLARQQEAETGPPGCTCFLDCRGRPRLSRSESYLR